MGLTQTKLHFKILREKWPGVVSRVEDVQSDKGRTEARTQNPLGDLALHFACYTGRAPAYAIRALLVAYPEGAGVRNKGGFLPIELAEVNYRMESPHRDEVLGVLRSATEAAIRTNDSAAESAREDSEMIDSGGQVYRTSDSCVVCLDNAATEVVVPCGHLCLCRDCSVQVRERRVCPVGRCFVGDIVAAPQSVWSESVNDGEGSGSIPASIGGESLGDDEGNEVNSISGGGGGGVAMMRTTAATVPAC